MDPAISLLRDLVAIDSVNPSLVPGRRRRGRDRGRASPRTCAGSGSTSRCRRSAPGRPNVIGVLEGRAPGRSLMFCGHIDTVGVEGMAAPFDPRRARRPALRPRLAGHEGRRRRDDRRRARRARTRGFARGPSDRRRGRRRGVREPRRRRARRASGSADARGRDRADRPADRRRPQGVRVGRGRDARARRARQPARATGATRSCAWAACCARSSARSRAAGAAAASAAWARPRCTRRSSTAGAS